MVKIRLRRMGAKKTPFYRIVVADSRYPRDGRFIEEIGTYNPLAEPAVVNVNADRAQEWIKNGSADRYRSRYPEEGRCAELSEVVEMKELLTYIVENLVSDPAAIAITEEIDGDNITYSLRVAPGDMGRVIGRHGRIAKEIRTLMKAAGNRENKRVTVDILD